MDQLQIDSMLRRRLYLQRYVTQLFTDVLNLNSETDQELIALINRFVAESDEATLNAISIRSTRNPAAGAFFQEVGYIVRRQHDQSAILVLEQLEELAIVEAQFVSTLIGDEDSTPLFPLPINGQLAVEIITTLYASYLVRLMDDITSNAARNPRDLAAIIQGTRSNNFRDGAMFWRNNRLIQPNIDRLVNGTSNNAANQVYVQANVEQVHWLATLDYRTCPSCYTAEVESPYDIGKAPRAPLHYNCRCIVIPSSVTTERPFVRDFRSVKDIPKGQRAGKIGTTRDTIEQFFNRMSDKDREDYMGKTRADRWKKGEINDIRQLVNSRTLRPLKLSDLPGN